MASVLPRLNVTIEGLRLFQELAQLTKEATLLRLDYADVWLILFLRQPAFAL